MRTSSDHGFGELLLDGEDVLLHANAALTAGLFQGLGEAVLTNQRILWTPSRDITNITLAWSPAIVEIVLNQIERVWAWAWMPSRILRIQTEYDRYGLNFTDARLTFSRSSLRRMLIPGLMFLEARKKSMEWEREIRRLVPKLSDGA